MLIGKNTMLTNGAVLTRDKSSFSTRLCCARPLLLLSNCAHLYAQELKSRSLIV